VLACIASVSVPLSHSTFLWWVRYLGLATLGRGGGSLLSLQHLAQRSIICMAATSFCIYSCWPVLPSLPLAARLITAYAVAMSTCFATRHTVNVINNISAGDLQHHAHLLHLARLRHHSHWFNAGLWRTFTPARLLTSVEERRSTPTFLSTTACGDACAHSFSAG